MENAMKKSNLNLCVTIAFLLSACLLTGCGGSKVLKEPGPLEVTGILASTSDQQLSVVLDWVIVRDGPGTWVKNAYWDEYLLRVSNQSGEPIQVTGLFVVDSLDTRIEPLSGRKPLVKGSKKTTRRYKDAGIKVTAGTGRGTMRVAGVAMGGAAIGAMTATGGIMGGAGFGAAAGGVIILVPALAVGGMVRGLNQGKVNKQIGERRTVFPLEVAAHETLGVDIFFPIAPSPKVVELNYTDVTGEHSVVIDTGPALDGLHIDAPKE